MMDTVIGSPETDLASAELSSVVKRLVTMMDSDDEAQAGGAASAVLHVGYGIARAALSVLHRSKVTFHRLNLIAVLAEFGLYAGDEAVSVLGEISVYDPDEDVRYRAMLARDLIKGRQRLDEDYDALSM